MKKINPVKTLIVTSIMSIVFFLAGCYEFDFVIQPSSAEKNSPFEVQISITTDSDGDGAGHIPYFGIKLPIGWTVQDSMQFYYTPFIWQDTGIFVYSDSLVQEMNMLDPPEEGYYWWVASGQEYVPYLPDLTYLFYPIITTDISVGTFYLDYMAGDNGDGETGTGLNRKRSNHNFIGIDLLPTVEVTTSSDNGPGSLREAISMVEFTGTIIFNESIDDTIFLESELDVYKSIKISGNEENPVCISGQNQTRIFNVFDSCSAELSGLNLINGYAANGGGVFCSNASLELHNLTVSGCSAAFDGGGLWGEYSQLIFTDLKISDCYADKGGGLCVRYSGVSGKDMHISTCNAAIGGGIYLESADLILQNALLNENTVSSHGGAIYCVDSSPEFRNVTVAGNHATYGSGLYHSRRYSGNNFLFENSIIYGNTSPNICLGTQSLNDPPSLTFYYSDLEGGQEEILGIGDIHWMAGNITEDPLFEGSGDHPFQLSTGSPCIDAGIADTTGLHLPMWDLIGNYRLWDGDIDGDTIVDMGAYEFGSVGVETPEFRVPGSGFRVVVYPNPAYEIVHIEYEIENPALVTILVFNAMGVMVAELSGGVLAKGQHQVTWNAADLPAGMYFCRVQAGQEVSALKILKQ